jgi:hypothetical protein
LRRIEERQTAVTDQVVGLEVGKRSARVPRRRSKGFSWGLGLYAVKDWLGHADIRSTLVYAQFCNAQRDAAAQKTHQQGS